MEELLIEVNTYEPNDYQTEGKKYEMVKIAFYDLISFDFGLVNINNFGFESNYKLVKYVLDELLLPSGKLMLRFEVLDLSDNNTVCDFKNKLKKLINEDQLVFCAQGFYRTVNGRTVIKTILVGVSKSKDQELKGTVRFFSIPDVLVKTKSGLSFKGVPFSWQECVDIQPYVAIENEKVKSLRPYDYLPLPQTEFKNSGIELGEFMELCDENHDKPARRGFDVNKFTLDNNFELFEDYTKYVKELTEQFPSTKKPFYSRRIIKNSAIIFRVGSDVESILLIQPPEPVFLNSPRSNQEEHRVAIQLKPNWSDKVDIEYIYLETRKSYFLNQFFFYNGVHDIGYKLSSSTILKARIGKLPTLEEQGLIVKKVKDEIFKQRSSDFELHKQLFNFEVERESLTEKIKEADCNANKLKREIVDSDPELRKYLVCCDAIIEQRRQEALQLLYFILPIKKCTEENISCQTSGLGNKARILMECIVQTLMNLHVVPVSFTVGNSINFICRDDADWATEISPELRTQLLNIKKLVNDHSHNEKVLLKNKILAITNTMISLMEWIKDFAARNSDKNRNLVRWVKNYEVKTSLGTIGRTGVVGIITNEWIDTRNGKKIGAWLKPLIHGADNIMVPKELVYSNKLGYGSIVKVNAVKHGNKWETTELEIVNNCPDYYQFTS